MKVAVVLLALVALTSASVLPVHKKVADKEFLQKQLAFLKLAWRVGQPIIFDEINEVGNTYNIQANLDKYTNVEAVKRFWTVYKNGMLPKDAVFSTMYGRHRYEAIRLFDLFFYAKDLDTLYKTACWARVHVNNGQFIYALHIAVLHRPDTQGLVLPPTYEIYPQLFLDSDVIHKAQQARMRYVSDTGDKTVVIPVNNTGMYPFYLYEDVMDKTDKAVNYRYRTGYDYLHKTHPEARMSYFTEDVGLNTWHGLFHMDNPFWMNETYGHKSYHSGERFWYVHQQLLARYHLERLSNDLPEIAVFMWDQPIEYGYSPNLHYGNGQEFPMRPDNVVPTDHHTFELEMVKQYEYRILSAIDLGYVLTTDGKKVALYEGEGMDIIGKMIEATADSVNPRYFGHLYRLSLRLLGHIFDPRHYHDVAPGVLEHYVTALRDPLYYRLWNRINKLFVHYKSQLPYYHRDELTFPGVKVESVDVEKLITYFDHFDIDASSAVTVNTKEDDKHFKVIARQFRLNHKPFNFKIDVQSDKAAEVMVRVFIGPKYDSEGRVLNYNEKRQYMVEIDRFPYHIESGKTSIARGSKDFTFTTEDFPGIRDLYTKINSALEGKSEFYLDEHSNHCGFPDRLVLPKGKKGGMPFTFFVAVTPRTEKNVEAVKEETYMRCGNIGTYFKDHFAHGYPFDRVIEEYEFNVPNFYEKDVIIFHKRMEEINNQSI